MSDFEAYGWGVTVLLLIAIAIKDSGFWNIYAIVAADWLLWSAFIFATQIFEPWGLGIILDCTAIWLLLRRPSNIGRAIIGGFYCLQVTMHIAFGAVQIVNGPVDVDVYALWLGYIGWAQLIILGGMGCVGGWRRAFGNRKLSSAGLYPAHYPNREDQR